MKKTIVKKTASKVVGKVVSKSVSKVASKVVSDGSYVENGIAYNQFGVCLDCNGGNLECPHNNMVEQSGKTSCAICGIAIL